jgi:GT2 family glycosyltransferase
VDTVYCVPNTRASLKTVIPAPDIAVIICTRNRAPRLRQAIAALQRLEYDGAWELIVVDNASSDDTPAVLDELSRGGALQARCTTEPTPGLARARNRGLQLANATIVAFTDDDCYPEPAWLTDIAACFAERRKLGFIGGRILLYSASDLPVTINTAADRQEFTPGTLIPPGAIQGANMAFRRAALEEVGGFDSRLGAGTPYPCEDIDAAAAISAAGWAGAFDPRPTVLHHHGRQDPAEGRVLLRSYMRGAGAYYAKRLADPRTRAACARHLAARMVAKPRFAVHEVAGALRYMLAGPGRPGA